MRTPDEIKKGLRCISEDIPCIVPCAYSEEPFPCAEHILRDIKEYIQQLEAALPCWISAKERLPENSDVNVMAIVSGRVNNIQLQDAYCLAAYVWDEGWIIDGYEELENPHVSFWMPLPEPPKKEMEES